MKKTSILSSLAIAAALACSSGSVLAEGKDSTRASMKVGPAGDAPRQIIDRAIAAHKALGAIPESVREKAECMVVVPGLTTAAVAIGGSHGDGVAVCKTGTDSWSSPAFVDLDAASLGVQLGAKSSDMVVYLTSRRAADALKQGKFMIGAEASVVAGQFERTFDVAGADAVAYQTNAGAFVGASVGAGKITSDDDSNRAFYGKIVQARDILNGTIETKNESAERLSKQLES